jgi:serine protease Do
MKPQRPEKPITCSPAVAGAIAGRSIDGGILENLLGDRRRHHAGIGEMLMPRTRPAVLAIAALSALLLHPSKASGQTPRAPATIADLSGSLEATARLVSPAVVEIFTTSHRAGDGLVPRTADLIATDRGSGSGVIVDPAGYIVTNAHVVRGAQRLRVEVPMASTGQSALAARSRSLGGQIVGIDPETDLAVIRVEGQNLPALTFGDSDELKAGQVVVAIGNPLGLHNSVTLGVVSSVARQLEPESPMIYVQTDASINPGSSGGPLVDLRGRLVGINTLIVSRAGGHEGLGFAAPSNIVRTVYEQIRKTGRVRRGDIGIRAQTVTPTLASGLKLARDQGVVVADTIPGSPAERAGLRAGDLVLALDGKPMENGRQLQIGLYRRMAGDVVSLEILRDGQTLKVPVTMTERPDTAGLSASPDPRQHLIPRLGVLGVDLDRRLAERLPARRVQSGVVVASAVAGAIDTRDGGLSPGDIVHAVNGTPVSGLADLRAAIDRFTPGDAVVLQIERKGELMYLAFTVD